MGLRLIGSPQSTCTLKVLLTLAEKGVEDFEFEKPDMMKGEHKLPAHLAKQPWGQIPVLEDGDFRLYESRAISRYLVQKYANQGNKLIPDVSDLKQMALFEQWVNVEMGEFDHQASSLVSEIIFKPKFGGGEPDEQTVTKLRETLSAKLEVFESVVLAKQLYMAGNEFTIVDIYYMPMVAYILKTEEAGLITSRPNLKEWWEKVSSRESWRKYGLASSVI